MVVGATDPPSGTPPSRTHASSPRSKGGSNAPQRRADSPISEITRTRDRRKLGDVTLVAEGHRQRRACAALAMTTLNSQRRTQTGAAARGVRPPAS